MFKIFVGNLNLITTGESIRKLFTRHADVSDIALPLNPETGKSRGFAIVMIKDEQQARTAMAALRGARLDGRALVINEARKKGEAPPPKREGRRGGGGGGGYRGRGGQGGGGGGSGGGFGPDRGGGGGFSGRGSYGRPRAYGNRPGGRPRNAGGGGGGTGGPRGNQPDRGSAGSGPSGSA